MKCPVCGTKNVSGAKTCGSCHRPLIESDTPAKLKKALTIIVFIIMPPFVYLLLFTVGQTMTARQLRFTKCVDALTSVRVAEEMYFTDHNVYAVDPNLLAMYMNTKCEDPTGTDPTCKNVVDKKLKTECREWNLWPGASGGEDSYFVTGVSKTLTPFNTKCNICMSPGDYLPKQLDHCGGPMACP